MAFIGQPSADKPWSLKVDGHHIALNLTFNAAHVSATPLFEAHRLQKPQLVKLLSARGAKALIASRS